MQVLRYLVQWMVFILLFTAAALSLELLEGSKITTTEYYGFQNIGLTFIVLMFLTACVLYPVTLLPISLLISKLVRDALLRVLFYCILGVIGGILMFNQLYSDRFIQEYGLNLSTAILIFGAAGIIYALLDHYLHKRSHKHSWK